MKIAAIVVTYNRKKCLTECLDAIFCQTYKPNTIYVVDNASDDGTDKLFTHKEFPIRIEYIRLKDNGGGAMGFHTGIKVAHQSKQYDGYWIMDDDGIPDKDCLKNLIPYLSNYPYVSSLVLSIENRELIAFQYLDVVQYNDIVNKYGCIIPNYSNPFNGVLFRRDLINVIGYPKKEMFIWGDEVEFQMRAAFNGYMPVTITSAIHYHPQDRLVLYKNFIGKQRIVYVDSELRRYCRYRNTAYSLKKYRPFVNMVYYITEHTLFYIINRKFDIKGLKFFFNAIRDGIKEDFTNHYKYI